jgi:hypothetical protein
LFIILNQDERETTGTYGHNGREWDPKDGSEKMEWEEYYENRNGRWKRRGIMDNEEELLMTKLEPTHVDTDSDIEDDRYD